MDERAAVGSARIGARMLVDCEAKEARHLVSSGQRLRSCLKNKKGCTGLRDAIEGKARRRRMSWADAELEDHGMDVPQLVGRQLVRFARRVKQMDVTPYAEVYGVHPRLFHFSRDGTVFPSSYFLNDPYEIHGQGRREGSTRPRRTGAEGERK